MKSLIDIDEIETREKIIKTLHHFLDNNDCIKMKINDTINIYNNIDINKNELKRYIYKYIEKYYIQILKERYDDIKYNFNNNISRCNYELSRRYIDISYDVNCISKNDDTHDYHLYYYKDYNYINSIFLSSNNLNFNSEQVYNYILFNSLNDSINKNKNINNCNIKNLNGVFNDSINKLNDKINDNYEILNNKINDKFKNNYEALNNKYNIMFEINIILFITVMYNLLFK